MTTPTHFFGGYLALSVLERHWMSSLISIRTRKGLYVYGLILSLAIDLDVWLAGGITDHHLQITHFPFFWLLLSLIIFLFGKALDQPVIRSLSLVTLIASWTHLLLDLVGITMGIHLFAPFSLQEFSLTPLKTEFSSEKERVIYIFQSPIMWIGDGIVILISLRKMLQDLVSSRRPLNLNKTV